MSKETDRTGLYIMVFITMLISCDGATKSQVGRVEEKVNKLETCAMLEKLGAGNSPAPVWIPPYIKPSQQ